MVQCQYVKPNGKRCEAYAVGNGPWCISHTKESKYTKIKAKAVRDGGKANTHPDGLPGWTDRPLERAQDVTIALSEVFNAAMRGEVSASLATAASSLCNGLMKSIELGDIEDRLAKLEKGKQ